MFSFSRKRMQASYSVPWTGDYKHRKDVFICPVGTHTKEVTLNFLSQAAMLIRTTPLIVQFKIPAENHNATKQEGDIIS